MLNNRGEAIDFLNTAYPYPDKVEILKEISMKLPKGESLVWLYKPPEEIAQDTEDLHHWLVDDETLVVTSLVGSSFTKAYKKASGRQTMPGSAIDEIRQGMEVSNERTLIASLDERLTSMVKHVADKSNYPLDYEHLAQTLDEIERDHELKPIEIVSAYEMCEARLAVTELQELAQDG